MTGPPPTAPPPGGYPPQPPRQSSTAGTVVKIALGICLGGFLLLMGCAALIAAGTNVDTSTEEEGTEQNDGGSKEKRGKARTYSFSGNGGKSLGTLRIARASTLRWTNDGDLFTVQDERFSLSVNSQGSSGSSQVSADTYSGVKVNAIGNWTMRIAPNR